MIKYLILGLGNPGLEYENTRHNVGFHLIDTIASRLGVELALQKPCKALVRVCRLSDECMLLLAKPVTFMNRSGEALQSLLRWHGISPLKSIVVTDNVDLDAGKLRVKKKGSGGTHNGIRSIQQYLKNMRNGLDYTRLYIGVGKAREHQSLAKYVLGKWHESEQSYYEESFKKAASVLISACKLHSKVSNSDSEETTQEQALSYIVSEEISKFKTVE